MYPQDELPILIKSGDARIGCKVRCTDDGFTGTIKHIWHDTDGTESFYIKNGAIGRDFVAIELVVFEETSNA